MVHLWEDAWIIQLLQNHTIDMSKAFGTLKVNVGGVGSPFVLDESETVEDLLMVQLGYYRSLDHLEIPTLQYHDFPLEISKAPDKLRRPQPFLEEHNHSVYEEVTLVSDKESSRSIGYGLRQGRFRMDILISAMLRVHQCEPGGQIRARDLHGGEL